MKFENMFMIKVMHFENICSNNKSKNLICIIDFLISFEKNMEIFVFFEMSVRFSN